MRILIVQTAFLGDVVLTLPLIESVSGLFPQAEVTVLTIPAHAPVLQGQSLIHRVLTYDKRGQQRGFGGLVRMMREIRSQKYAVVVSPHRSLRSALLVAASGSAKRIGFRHWLTRWAYTDTISRSKTGHEVERNHQLVAVVDPDAEPPSQIPFEVDAAAHAAAVQMYAEHGVAASDVMIGLIPGSQWGTKRWPAEQFVALAERLTATSGTHCVLFGSPQDRPIADAIVAACQAPLIDLVGKTPLAELAASLSPCAVVVSNDTGPMHVAAALGKPIVTLFGPTTAALGFAPYGVDWEDAGIELECRPCHAHGPHECPLTHWRCMRELSAERVANRVQRLLQRRSHADEVEA